MNEYKPIRSKKISLLPVYEDSLESISGGLAVLVKKLSESFEDKANEIKRFSEYYNQADMNDKR